MILILMLANSITHLY